MASLSYSACSILNTKLLNCCCSFSAETGREGGREGGREERREDQEYFEGEPRELCLPPSLPPSLPSFLPYHWYS